MRTGYQLAQLIKEVKSPNNNDRLARALFVANAVGYRVTLDPANTWQQCVEDNMKDFKEILNQVNENVTVDTKIATAAFERVVRIRYELMMGVSDPAVVQMALRSYTTEVIESPEQKAMTDWLVSRAEFETVQNAATQVLDQYFAEK